jgi:hypothetical protein
MKASRTHRDALRSRVARSLRADVVVALLALLAQIALPHVHRWQVAAHPVPDQLHVLAGTPALESEHAATGHAETGCPICQALAGSHDFLATAAHRTAPVTSALAHGALSAARTAQTPGGEHAPRGPPRFA